MNPADQLLAALSAADIGGIRMALDAGACPNLSDEGVPIIGSIASTLNAEALQLVLSYGADPNARDRDGWTPLMWAAFSSMPGDAEGTLCALEAAGADLNACDSKGRTALDIAVKGVSPTVMQWLHERGAQGSHASLAVARRAALENMRDRGPS